MPKAKARKHANNHSNQIADHPVDLLAAPQAAEGANPWLTFVNADPAEDPSKPRQTRNKMKSLRSSVDQHLLNFAPRQQSGQASEFLIELKKQELQHTQYIAKFIDKGRGELPSQADYREVSALDSNTGNADSKQAGTANSGALGATFTAGDYNESTFTANQTAKNKMYQPSEGNVTAYTSVLNT